MNSKYDYNFNNSTVKKDITRLINQLWKLIPMKENDENWKMHLNVVIEELIGLNIIFNNQLDLLILLSKLEGLTSEICEDFMIYRKTVFRCIDLLAKAGENIE